MATARESWGFEEATAKFRLPAGRNLKVTKTVNVHIEDPKNVAAETKRKQEEIRQYFHATFELFERVFRALNSEESYTIPPVHKLRHPLIFYLGHTATFYINKLALAGLTTRINHKYEETFAVGVDEMSWDDLNEAHYDWPAISQVYEYRRAVRNQIDSLFDQFRLTLPLCFDKSSDNEHNAFYWAILMGCEHERIHIETASVHVRELPLKYVNHDAYWDPCTETNSEAPKENPMVEFAGGSVRVGRPADDAVYGWDCDYAEKLAVDVAAFKASEHLVSNAEFYEFVKDGGYTKKELWDEEGWNWVTWKKPLFPWFWLRSHDGSFLLRTQNTEIPLPWSWPAEVNNLEASAYCKWMSIKKGKKLRLPTEAEWLHMWDVCVGQGNDQWQWKKAPGNVNLEEYASTCSVTKFKQGKLYDVVGNVWQHCETPVYPYQGYKVHPLYDDFSMPTFDGKHRCMKGGAWISTGNEATRDARFAFRRHFFQYIGIRMIEGSDVDETRHVKNVLGLDPPVDLAAQRSFHALPTSVDVSPKEVYPKVLADMASEAFTTHCKRSPQRALDILTGAGRAAYELTLTFKSVTGVDFSARMLQPAYSMRERGVAQYSTLEAVGSNERRAAVAEASNFAWKDNREDVVFYQSDPANLHAHLKDYDMILAFNIVDQNTSYNPALVPAHLVSRLQPGGMLFVAEPKEKRHAASLSIEAYRSLIADSTVTVMPPTTVPLYMPETTTEGKIVNFEVFAVIKKE